MMNRLPDVAVILKLFAFITYSNRSSPKKNGTMNSLYHFVDSYAEISAYLFKILHLFTHLFNQHFKFHGDLRYFRICRFRTERIRFTVELLHQEI